MKQPVFKTAIASMMLLAIASCHNVHEVPFPEELSEPPQPKTVPLEFTDPISAHWDTLGKADFNPAIFHLDFNKMPGEPYDPNGFKPLPAPTITHFNFDELPVTHYTPEKEKEIALNMQMKPLPLPSAPIIFQKPLRLTTTTADVNVWQQIPSMNTQVNDILIDSSGLMWLASAHLMQFDGTSISTILPNTLPYAMTLDRQGNLWFLSSQTYRSILYKVDLTNNLYGSAILPYTIASAYCRGMCDHDGSIWFSSTPGSPLFRIAPNAMTYAAMGQAAGLEGKYYHQAAPDNRGHTWHLSERGIEIADKKTQRIRHLNKINGLSGDTVYAATSDKSGRMWTLSSEDGKSILQTIDEKRGSITRYWLDFPSNSAFYFIKFDAD